MADYQLQQGLNTGLQQFWDAYKGERDRSQDLEMKRAALAQAKAEKEKENALKIFELTGNASVLPEDVRGQINPQSMIQGQQPQSMLPGQETQYPPTSKLGQRQQERTKTQLEIDRLTREAKQAPMKELEQAQNLKKGSLDIQSKQREMTQLKPDAAKAALFGKRLEQAENVFSDLEKQGFNRADQKMGVASMLPGFAQPGNLKQQEQAERNFVNALLRRESGSAISDTEFKSAEQQYFPRVGDTPEVLAQKKANRLLAFEGLKAESGPQAWESFNAPTVAVKQNMSGMAQAADTQSPPPGLSFEQFKAWKQKNAK